MLTIVENNSEYNHGLQMSVPYYVSVIATALTARQLKLAVAESCTGGLLASALTQAEGASVWFSGGIVAYSNDLKEKLLAVPANLLTTYGSVSEESAEAMCDGLFALGASAAISTTGIAGPAGGTPDKPVGSVCFCVRIADNQTWVTTKYFTGAREAIRTKAMAYALAMLAAILNGQPLPIVNSIE